MSNSQSLKSIGLKATFPRLKILDLFQKAHGSPGERHMSAEDVYRHLITEDIDKAVSGVDFVYTDVWVSMGEPTAVWEERINALSGEGLRVLAAAARDVPDSKDALVIDVVKSGPACHTGAESCFFNPVYVSDELKQFTWQGLYELIEGRKTNPKEGSYTTYLFDKGLEKILKKVGEESTEVIIAGSKRDKEETVYEISDLAYHVMVLMIELGISVEDITKELEKRHVIDHKVKQERMQ